MKYESPMLIVQDLERSKSFYSDVLGLRVILDFGANITLTGGISMQTKESWKGFVQKEDSDLVFGGNTFELYFEEPEFDAFLARLETLDVDCVHPVCEHRWGQRAVRIYDPDRHILEIGESMQAVCRRFADSGMTQEQIAARMDVPLDYVRDHLNP